MKITHLFREAVEDDYFEDIVISHATRVKEEYGRLEMMYKRIVREKDAEIMELRRRAEQIPTVEKRLLEESQKNAEVELQLEELNKIVCKHIGIDTIWPLRVPADDVDRFLREEREKNISLKEEMENLNRRLDKEKLIKEDLNETIASLRRRLDKAELETSLYTKRNERSENQPGEYRQTINQLKLSCERKYKENELLRARLREYEASDMNRENPVFQNTGASSSESDSLAELERLRKKENLKKLLNSAYEGGKEGRYDQSVQQDITRFVDENVGSTRFPHLIDNIVDEIVPRNEIRPETSGAPRSRCQFGKVDSEISAGRCDTPPPPSRLSYQTSRIPIRALCVNPRRVSLGER